MDVPRQGGDVGDLRNVRLLVENRLIKVGHAPPLGDVEMEQFRQRRRCLPGDGVLPGPEGNQQVPILVKGQIAVHHGGHTDGGDALSVFNAGKDRFQTCPDLIQTVGPDSIFIAGGPDVVPGGDRAVILIDGQRLDPGGAKFDPKACIFHIYVPPLTCFTSETEIRIT